MAGTITATTIQNDTSSPPTFRNNSVEIGTLCRAWVNYNGSAQSIRSSFNVSSVTYNSTGDYTINFTNALPDANYAATGIVGDFNTSNSARCIAVNNGTAPTTTALRITMLNSSGTAENHVRVFISVFR